MTTCPGIGSGMKIGDEAVLTTNPQAVAITIEANDILLPVNPNVFGLFLKWISLHLCCSRDDANPVCLPAADQLDFNIIL